MAAPEYQSHAENDYAVNCGVKSGLSSYCVNTPRLCLKFPVVISILRLSARTK